jgi:hypothetical protein
MTLRWKLPVAVLRILQDLNDCLRGQPMPDCVAERAPFTSFGFWPRTHKRIAAIGLDLSM